MEGTWTILELAELAAERLGAERLGAERLGAAGRSAPAEPDGAPARTNGRVRDVPNERLIRWYVTVGLVDPPLSRRGRVARYGRRHLLQLVAVKRRQAEGRSLAEIQTELAGATDESLARVAGIPDTRPGPEEAAPDGAAPDGAAPDGAAPDGAAPDGAAPDAGSVGTGRFWARAAGRAAGAAEPLSRLPAAAAVPPAELVHGIRLAPGVMLLLEGADHEPGPAELTHIVNAARPLLRELAGRGLLKGAGHDL